MSNKAAGKAISALRQRLDLTQAEVVAALQSRGVDISLSTYQRLEYGQSLKPFLDRAFVERLADIFRTTPNALMRLVGLVEDRQVIINALEL